MNRSGEYVNNLSGEVEYKSFRPSLLPLDSGLTLNNDIIQKVIKANKDVAKLDAFATFIPNAELFISMYVRKEALLTSQIEGTQCTLDDVLDPDINNNTNLDVEDVINYIKAVSFAIEKMNELPLCNRLFKEVHKCLMSGVRGQEKNPGEFRHSQNWIGSANCSLKDARYIPPNVEDMEKAMSNLEEYINYGNDYDPLIRIALIHYQFETIHPFLDGNGRIGRLIIMLFLLDQKLMTRPVLYISLFLKKNRIEYYDRISEVRRTGNYEQWVSFFLEAVSSAAIDSIETIEKLEKLHNKNIEMITKIAKGKNADNALFTYLELHPIIDIKGTASALNLSYNTISKSVNNLLELGILRKTTNQARNRVFAYEDYLKILRKDT